MKTVYKYKGLLTDLQMPELPVGAEILRVDVQNNYGEVCIWALVDPNEYLSCQRNIRIAGTGHPIEQRKLKYINTFTASNGTLWFHAFEVLE